MCYSGDRRNVISNDTHVNSPDETPFSYQSWISETLVRDPVSIKDRCCITAVTTYRYLHSKGIKKPVTAKKVEAIQRASRK